MDKNERPADIEADAVHEPTTDLGRIARGYASYGLVLEARIASVRRVLRKMDGSDDLRPGFSGIRIEDLDGMLAGRFDPDPREEFIRDGRILRGEGD